MHKNDHVRTLKIMQSMSEFSGLWKHENTAHRRRKKKGSAVLWLLAFPGESSPNFLCVALGQESYLIESNLIWRLVEMEREIREGGLFTPVHSPHAPTG